MDRAEEEALRKGMGLPEDASAEGTEQYFKVVRQKIELGLQEVEAGRTLSEDEFDRRMSRWLEPSGNS